MATDNTPQGIVADKTPATPMSEQDAEDAFDSFIDDLEEGTGDEADDQAEGENPDDQQDDDADVPADDEEDTEGEDGDQPRDEKGRFISDESKVRMADGSVVTVNELKRGFLREADYTKKNQEVASLRKQSTDRIQRVEQLERTLADRLEWSEQVIGYLSPKKPDPSERYADPIGYEERKERWEEAQAYLNSTLQERGRITAEQQALRQAKMAERLPEEKQRLTSVIPELSDKKRFEKFVADAVKVGSEVYHLDDPSIEWLPEVINSSHFLHVLNDAMNWQRFKAQKAKAQEKAVGKPPVTPGRRQSVPGNQARSSQKALQTLKSTGGHGRAGEAAWDALADKFV